MASLPKQSVPVLVVCLAAFLFPSLCQPALAQTSRDVRLMLTVVDSSGAVLQGATVTVIGLEAATKGAAPAPGKTSDKGLVVLERLPAGRYSIQAEFPGFGLGLLRDIRLREGENKHVVVLPLKGLTDAVTVTGEKQQAASSRSGPAFGTALTREQIEALSDDPEEMARQLADLAGPNAILRIDSFEGAELPAKAQIKSIHVTRDQFAAETEQPGSIFVDVITQAGAGPLRGGMGMNFQDSGMNAKSPFTPTKAPSQNRNINGNVGGTIVRNKSDFSVSMNHGNFYSTPSLNANLPAGRRSEVVNLKQPGRNFGLSGLFNYALTRDQTLRIGYNQNRNTRENIGVGLYDLPERAYSTTFRSRNFRIQEAGPIGRRMFLNSRLMVNWFEQSTQSAVEAQTIEVQDEFTRGGAQTRGGTRQVTYTLASDLDYIRGIHSWRTGVQVLGSRFHTNAQTDYLGTYTFSSLAEFEAGRPLLYTRNTGAPDFGYGNVQAAVYFQDDIRVSKALTLSPGVRYSLQTHVDDSSAIEPRFGMTWAPFKSGRTTLRASTGIFHFWLANNTYEQTLRFDGFRQQQVVINNPTFPDPGTPFSFPPTNRYLLGDYHLGKNLRHSAGIDQAITPTFRVSVVYSYMHQMRMPRGHNLNAPVNGVRPNTSFANVTESITDGEVRRHDLDVSFNLALSRGGAAANRALVNWRRVTVNGNFFSALGQRNVLGPFSVPPSNTLDAEWGPVPASTRQVFLSVNSTQVRNLTVNVNLQARAPSVYTETTGFDDNRDGLLNDRRPGVGLNTLRTSGMANLNVRFAYLLAVGPPPTPTGVPAPAAVAAGRYRVNLFVNINNLPNRYNYTGYSGVMTSSNFQKATSVQNPRNVNMGMNISF